MDFSYKNNYTLYIKLASNSPVEMINYYKEVAILCMTKEDSGIDLYIPYSQTLQIGNNTIDHMINCYMINNTTGYTTGYYLYPRSSIYKYNLIMANSVGIIDAGYRGSIKANVKCDVDNYNISNSIKLFQICAPDLSPLSVIIIDNNTILPESIRGNNGFGSSGN